MGKQVDTIQNYVGDEDSRILIIYGNPTSAELSVQLEMVDNTNFKK